MTQLGKILLRSRQWMGRRRRQFAIVQAATPVAGPKGEPHEGWVEELSSRHASGWMRSKVHQQQRSAYEVILSDTGEVLATGRADQYKSGLSGGGIGDGTYGFWVRFARLLSEAERQRVVVRPTPAGDPLALVPLTLAPLTLAPLALAPWATTAYEPVLHVAMDIVNNCNLRCPFCLVDYSDTRATYLMTEATLDAALRFLPFTRDGEFWFSCLHEPTLHPDLTRFLDKVPAAYRRKIFYTTNLSKRMPASYFAWLAGCGVHHINISIESLEPVLFERMRKGARHRIFMANWEALLDAFGRAPAPPRLRYIAMAYKSNLRELPDLVAHLLTRRRASQVEVRYTFDVPHIPADFKQAEFLDADDWTWLRDQLSHYRPEQVQLVLPPMTAMAEPGSAPGDGVPVDGTDASAADEAGATDGSGAAEEAGEAAPADRTGAPGPAILAGRYMLRMSWDGSLRIHAILASSRYDDQQERLLLHTNVTDIADPAAFLDSLARFAA